MRSCSARRLTSTAQWIEKDKTIDVDNPATGEVLGTVPQLDAADTRRAIEAANRAFPAWRAKTAKERASVLRKLVRPDDGEPGRPRAPDDARAGQAAGRIEGRDGVRRVVPRMVRRRGQARLRRHHPAAPARQAHRRAEGTGRRRGVHHAVEFSAGDDHAQGRPRASPRAARSCSNRRRRRRSRRWRWRSSASAPDVPKGVFNVHHGIGQGDRRRADVEPARAQAVVHRIDRDRQAADGAVRGDDQEGVAGARRQRAVHRVRRCRPRCGGRGRDPSRSTAIPGRRASAPIVCSCRTASTTRSPTSSRSAVRKLRPGVGPRSRTRRRARSSTTARSTRSRSTSRDATAKGARVLVGGNRHKLGGRFFEPTILTDVTPAMLIAREETFGPVAPLFRFKTDAEAIALANDTEFGLAAYFYGRDIGRIWTRGGRARVRNRGHQHRHHLDGSGAIRRDEAVGDRSRGIEVRDGGVSRDRVLVPWGHQIGFKVVASAP